MADQEVSYTLSLKDLFTGKIKEADKAVNHMEGSLHEAGNRAGQFGARMLEGIGVGMAVWKGMDFVKESKEQFEQLELANSQIEAGLESTRGVAGLTFDELTKGAAEAAHNLKFTQGQVESMQSVLLTFPSVTKQTFGSASQAIFDMSTRLKTDLNSTAIQVGKALQDPIKGVTALRRVGVNFNEAQTEMIKKMVAGGQAAKAQAFILKELQTEFGGSAAAAAKADVAFRFNKSWEEIKLTVGELVNNLMKRLAPALEWISSRFQDVVEWIKRHNELMTAVVDILLPVAGAIAAVVVATKTWAAVQWLLNAATSANPISLIIIGIAAFVSGIVYAYNHCAKFRAVLLGLWETVKEFGRIIGDVFMGIQKMVHGAFTLNWSEVKEGFHQGVDAIANAGMRLGSAFKKGYDDGLAGVAGASAQKDAPHTIAKAGPKGAAGESGTPAKQLANPRGQKNVTINIKIDNLVRDFRIQTTNLMESAGKVKELMTQALLSAVNDSQIVAGE